MSIAVLKTIRPLKTSASALPLLIAGLTGTENMPEKRHRWRFCDATWRHKMNDRDVDDTYIPISLIWRLYDKKGYS